MRWALDLSLGVQRMVWRGIGQLNGKHARGLEVGPEGDPLEGESKERMIQLRRDVIKYLNGKEC